MNSLSPIVQKFVAVGLFVALVLLALLYGVLPLTHAYSAADERIGQAQEMLTRLSTSKIDPAAQQQRLAQLQQAIAQSGDYLRSSAWSGASVELTEYVETAIRDSGAQIQSRQVLGDGSAATREVVLRVAIQADIDGLYQTLYALESRKPLLSIGDLNVQAQAMPGTEQDKPLMLRAQFNVTAFLPPEAAE
ncbi:type II secretion system protein GspM [Rhodoligotrophos defluvii]|uniref:type II secretion system protein GspM n=1 Tax=Rhodoligotrophos defluvii TaxID=2561934 RepID=UPI0010C9DDD2|nr:type II secretion system protein GspM [Rhodoligotrophos defluvii]